MNDMATGALSKVVIGFESAFNTIALEGFVLPIVKSTLRGSRNKSASQVIRGDFNPVKPTGGRYSVAGQITVPLDCIALWYWLKAAFNTLTTTGIGPYEHEFKMTGAVKRSSITIEHQFTDLAVPQYFQYTGCKISGMAFTVGDEGEILVNLDVVGAKEIVAASSFDAAATVVGYYPLGNAEAAIKEGGATYGESTQVSCNIAFNPDTSKYVIGGGGYLGAIPDGIMKVSGNMDFLFTDMVLLNKAINSTESSIEATFEAAADRAVKALFPEVEYAPNSPTIDGPQGVMASLPWEGFYDNATEASSVVITVTNAEAHA